MWAAKASAQITGPLDRSMACSATGARIVVHNDARGWYARHRLCHWCVILRAGARPRRNLYARTVGICTPSPEFIQTGVLSRTPRGCHRGQARHMVGKIPADVLGALGA